MNEYLIRMLIALLLAVFLLAQARAVRGQPHRRRAFALAAAALLAFAAFNGTLATGMALGRLPLLLAALGALLLIGAVVSLAVSLRRGEIRQQSAQIAGYMREFREQRSHGQPRQDDDPNAEQR
jgi:small-conductance mechanosensitive channel